MPKYWILKSDPDTYSFDHLEKDGRTVWDGVKNPQALNYIRSMKQGDQALIYHSGKDKSIVGQARIVSDPYADPKRDDPKLTVVEIETAGRVPRPVSLAEIKADPAFKQLALVRQSRLSVVPAPPEQWKRLLAMAGVR